MRRARHVVPILVFVLALVVAACAGPAASGAPTGAATASGPAGSGGGAGSPSQPAPSDDASAGQPTDEPADTTPPATAKPAKTPKPSTSPDASLDAGAASDCTGTDDNRTFFAGVAAQVDWTVVCAVLPKRWFVSSGTFRLAKGGRLLISYDGPSGATLSLSEGAWCPDPGSCIPAGTDLGDAVLGPLAGTLIGVDGGGFAVMVDGGQSPSWLLETQGVDQATTVKLAAAAVAVGD